jgi:hypothetical protein
MKLEDIKANDYIYYTERPHSDDADSLIHVRDINGVLIAHPVCTNWRGEYINETNKNWGHDIPVSAYFDEKCWFPTHYIGGDPAAWMTIHFPLANETRPAVGATEKDNER